MYYKKFSDKEMQLIRQAVEEIIKIMNSLIANGDDKYKKDLKIMEKIQKKLVHCFYLSRK